ncbi:MAG: hypothetical protein DVB26_06525 [Verrucomicrobia bacterium]|nr:MAG: hypothetical protein DVB26_06525 [Verrucomicrobiota bacterium]
MKLKNTNKLAIWALAISASITLAQAASTPASGGYTTVAGAPLADTLVSTNPAGTITVVLNSTLTGNAGTSSPVSITLPSFTLSNSGSLTALTTNNSAGVTASAATTLTNTATGVISSNTAQGISLTVGTGSTITNAGAISSGTVQGILLAAGTSATITNSVGGTISGVSAGVSAATGLTLINNSSITATALTGSGVLATTGASITNSGSISATGATGSGVQLTTGISGIGSITNTGAITGAATGVKADNGLTLTNSSSITATAATGSGVLATTNATITNNVGSSISGGAAGVSATTGLILTNSNAITASAAAGSGVLATTGASITNSGTINATGTIGGVATAAATGNGVQLASGTITNTGTITAASATSTTSTGNLATGILLTGGVANSITNSGNIGSIGASAATSSAFGLNSTGTANDTLNMNGGTINGITAVSLGAGDDTLNFKAGTINAIIAGAPGTAVDGGAGINDTLSFTGVSGNTAIINGNVSNFEFINKTGAGMATINGNITAASVITVTNDGVLFLNGTINSGSAAATINLGGGLSSTAMEVLGGTGIWNANVIQTGGRFTPGTAPMAIGNLTISALNVTGGSLLVNMNPVNQTSDLLSVTGNASISGATISVSPTTLDAPLQSTSTRVLAVTGTRTGQYSAANFHLNAASTDTGTFIANPVLVPGPYQNFTSSTVSLSVTGGNVALGQNVNDSYVTVVHHYDTVAGLSTDGQQLGSALNSQVANSLTNPLLADFLGYLDYSSAATVAGVLNGYAPTNFQASLAYSEVSAREIHRIVEQQNLGDSLFPSNNHVWANYNANSYLGSGSASRYTMGLGGSAIDTIHFGGLVSYANANLTDNSSNESLAYGAYAGVGAATGWQLNGYIGGSHNKTTTTTSPTTFVGTPLASVLNFNPDGNSFQALLSGAYLMEESFCTWGPTFGVEMVKSTLNGSLAPGATLPSMSYSSDTLTSLRTLLGLRAEFTLSSKVRPYLSAQWAREFDGKSNGYTASSQGASFSVNSPINLASDSIILRGGVVIGLTDSCFADVGYLGEYSTSGDNADYNGVNLGLRAAF